MPSEDVLLRMRVDTSDFSGKMRELNKSLREVKADFKSSVAGMTNWKTSAEGLKAKISSLGKEYEILKSKLSAQKSLLSEQQSAYTKNAQTAEQLKQKLAELRENGVSETSAEYRKYASELTKVEAEMTRQGSACSKLKTDIKNTESAMKQNQTQTVSYAQSLAKVEAEMRRTSSAHEQLKSKISSEKSELDDLKSKYTSLVLEQKKGSQEAKDLENQIRTLSSTIDKHENDLKEAEAATEGLTTKNKSLKDAFMEGFSGANIMQGGITGLAMSIGSGLLGVVQSAVGAVKDFATSCIETGMNFESSMSNVAALSGATGGELQALTDYAREMGATTVFSASEAADALGYMALAGWNTQQMTDGLPAVLNLAAAGAMELGTASDMVTDVMAAFGIETKDAGQFVDELAYTQAHANTSAQQLGEAFQNCAANMNASGQSATTTTAMLGMLSNEQLKGSQAGTALAAMMRDLSNKMEDGAIKIGDTSVKVVDANGNFRDMIDIVADVESATDGMGTAQKTAALSSTFTADSIKGMNILLNEGSGKLRDFAQELKNSGGSAEEMAAVMNDNLEGDMKAFGSALDDIKISIYNGVAPALRACVQFFTDFLLGVGNAMKGASEFKIVGDIFSGVWTAIQGIWNTIGAPIFGFIVDKIQTIVGAFQQHMPAIQELFNAMCVTISNLWNNILQPVLNVLGVVIEQTLSVAALGFDIFVEVVGTAINNIVSFFTNVLFPIFNDLIAIVNAVFSCDWSAAWQLCKDLVRDAITGIGQFLSDLVENIGNFASQAINHITTWVTDTCARATEWASTFPENIRAGLEGFISAIGEKITEAVTSFSTGATDMINGFVQGIQGGIETAVTAVTQWCTDILNGFKSFFGINSPSTVMAEQGTFMVEGLISTLQEMPGKCLEIFQNVLSNALSWGGEMVSNAVNTGKDFFSGLKDKVSQVPGNVKGFLDTTFNNAKNFGSNFIAKAKESGSNFFNNIKSYLSQVPGNVGSNLSGALGHATSWVGNMASKATQTASRFLGNIKSGLANLAGSLASRFNEGSSQATSWQFRLAGIATSTGSRFMGNLRSAFSGVGSAMASVGSQICSGISSGISSGWGWLTGQVSSLANSLLGSAKRALGIKSPSRKFRDLVGRFIPAGIGEGVKKYSSTAIDSIRKLGDDMLASVQPLKANVSDVFDLGNINTAGNKNAASRGLYGPEREPNVIYNFTQNNTSPKALSRKEIYRQTKNALGFVGGH